MAFVQEGALKHKAPFKGAKSFRIRGEEILHG
jgi:hypothetical protein